MNTTDPRRVLVTGVGGQPGFDLARRLAGLGCEVIGTDADPWANGLLLPGIVARRSALSTDPDYARHLLQMCREDRVQAIVSAVESELVHLHSLRGDLEALGVRTWLPPLPTIRACTDKAEFARALAAHDIAVPATWMPGQLDAIDDESELVVKPRRGQGSQNVVFCRGRAQARALCAVIPDPIVQARITGGREFTADCLVDRDRRASVILRYRLLTKGGLSMVSATFDDHHVREAVTAALAALGYTGLCCVQGFLRQSSDSDEPVVITEVNARAAGGFLLAEAAGADLIGQMLAGLWNQPVEHDRLRYRPGVYLTKYIDTLASGPCPDLDNGTIPGASLPQRGVVHASL